MKNEIINIALEKFKELTEIPYEFFKEAEGTDGKLELSIKNKKYVFRVEVKKEMRNHQLHILKELAEQNPPFLVIAKRILPNVRENLIDLRIAYIEANGNVHIRCDDFIIFIDNQKPLLKNKEKLNRAFTKVGLKFIFQLLLNHKLLNLPYREITEETGIAFTNLPYILNGLIKKGFVVKKDDKIKKLVNKEDLLKAWIERYEDNLKPNLKIGTFRFADKQQFKNWEKIKFKTTDILWGGEPAATLLTKYLNPEILTIYTTKTKTELIKKYKLIPDNNGNIEVYKKFWETNNDTKNIVPTILVYADLINSNDSRQIETANLVYDEYIKNKY